MTIERVHRQLVRSLALIRHLIHERKILMATKQALLNSVAALKAADATNKQTIATLRDQNTALTQQLADATIDDSTITDIDGVTTDLGGTPPAAAQ